MTTKRRAKKRVDDNFILTLKRVRAEEIVKYIEGMGYDGCVCFSCGNSSSALKRLPIDVVDISPTGQLSANEWWTMARIRRVFPRYFDATSGHLPIELMNIIARRIADNYESMFCDDVTYEVPTGSGESILCLRLAFPNKTFVAVYSTTEPHSKYDVEAPLNGIISMSGETILE